MRLCTRMHQVNLVYKHLTSLLGFNYNTKRTRIKRMTYFGFLLLFYVILLILTLASSNSWHGLSSYGNNLSVSSSPPLSLSRIVRKPDFCLCENKGADQLRGNREADQRLCFRYSDSTIPLLLKSEITSF